MMPVSDMQSEAGKYVEAKDELLTTARTALHRRPDRGSNERALINAVIDESLVCHVGFIDDGQPVVVPSSPWRIDEWLYLHGAAGSRLIRQVASGVPLCVSFALVDGLVFARSAMRHSTNYRSVVLFGQGEAIEHPAGKTAALMHLVEKLSPGRSELVRPPNERELAITSVVRLPILEGSAKVRAEGPTETSLDEGWEAWVGTVATRLRSLEPTALGGSPKSPLPMLPDWLRG